MKKIAIALVAVVLSCGIWDSLRAQQQVNPPGTTAPVGRYRLSVNELGMYCIDSATGQVWFKARGAGKWDDEGNPAIGKDVPRKGR